MRLRGDTSDVLFVLQRMGPVHDMCWFMMHRSLVGDLYVWSAGEERIDWPVLPVSRVSRSPQPYRWRTCSDVFQRSDLRSMSPWDYRISDVATVDAERAVNAMLASRWRNKAWNYHDLDSVLELCHDWVVARYPGLWGRIGVSVARGRGRGPGGIRIWLLHGVYADEWLDRSVRRLRWAEHRVRVLHRLILNVHDPRGKMVIVDRHSGSVDGVKQRGLDSQGVLHYVGGRGNQQTLRLLQACAASGVRCRGFRYVDHSRAGGKGCASGHLLQLEELGFAVDWPHEGSGKMVDYTPDRIQSDWVWVPDRLGGGIWQLAAGVVPPDRWGSVKRVYTGGDMAAALVVAQHRYGQRYPLWVSWRPL